MRSIRSGTEGVRDFDFLKHGSQIKWGRYKVHTHSIIYYFFSACQYSILQLLKVCQLNRNGISEYSSANIIGSQLLLHILAYRHNSIHICQFCETQTDWLSHLGWSYQSQEHLFTGEKNEGEEWQKHPGLQKVDNEMLIKGVDTMIKIALQLLSKKHQAVTRSNLLPDPADEDDAEQEPDCWWSLELAALFSAQCSFVGCSYQSQGCNLAWSVRLLLHTVFWTSVCSVCYSEQALKLCCISILRNGNGEYP